MKASANPLRVGVLGVRRQAWFDRGPALAMLRDANPGQIELVAVCDAERAMAQSFAGEFGFQKVCEDPRQMLREEPLDVLVVIPGIPLVADLMEEIFARGMGVFLERPPAIDLRRTQPLLQLAEKHGTPHMVSFNRWYNPATVLAEQWLAENAAGRPVLCVSAKTLRNNQMQRGHGKRMSSHPVATAHKFLGPARHVSASKVSCQARGTEIFVATATYGQGQVVQYLVAPDAGAVVEICDYMGGDYCIRVDVARPEVRVFDHRHEVFHWAAPLESEPPFRGGSFGQTEAFLRGVQAGQKLRPDLKDTLAIMSVVEAIDAGGEFDFGL